MHTHIINFKNSSVILGNDLIESNLIIEACKTRSVAIIADHHIGELYGKKIVERLLKASIEAHLFTFTAGESAKSRANKEAIEDQMLAMGLGRDTTLIGLGGGVTTDLTGFIAATYFRGIPLLLIPTSLLAMVDASLGGKNGVNTSAGKNLIGTFYLPEAVLIDYNFLKTLPLQEVKEGFVEMIKTALIYDEKLYQQLESFCSKSFVIHDEIKGMIQKCCQIKLDVVSKDFEEKAGIRRILNFGHTVGHALERLFEYQITHGQAVALGIIAESFISCELGILSKEHMQEITHFLKSFAPIKIFNVDQAYDAMILDKKSKDKIPRFVILKTIGKVLECHGNYCDAVDPMIVKNALRYIQEL